MSSKPLTIDSYKKRRKRPYRNNKEYVSCLKKELKPGTLLELKFDYAFRPEYSAEELENEYTLWMCATQALELEKTQSFSVKNLFESTISKQLLEEEPLIDISSIR